MSCTRASGAQDGHHWISMDMRDNSDILDAQDTRKATHRLPTECDADAYGSVDVNIADADDSADDDRYNRYPQSVC